MRMVWEPMTRQSLDGCKNDNDGDGHGDGSRAEGGVRDNVPLFSLFVRLAAISNN